MKRSILLTGNNKVVIGEFFTHLSDRLECLSCSPRSEDVCNHLKHFTPDVIVYCLYNETSNSINQVVSYREKENGYGVPLVVIGSRSECDLFEQTAPNMAKLILVKPISLGKISSQLNALFREKEKQQEEEQKKDELLSAVEEAYNNVILEDEQARKRVLVVDDDTLMLKLIKEHLREDYDVATAISGKIALKFLEHKKADLILLDYEMPGEDGPSVLKTLHENSATKDIPVIFLTGITETDKIKKVLALKPQGYLLKPIDRDKLIAVIKGQIG